MIRLITNKEYFGDNLKKLNWMKHWKTEWNTVASQNIKTSYLPLASGC